MNRFPLLILLLLITANLGTSPAQGEPVLADVSVSPGTISPNGDFVQDGVRISYTVLVPAAQVSLILTPPGGGGTVHVIQPLTLEEQGVHIFTFDGFIEPGEPVPDGDYSVRVYGVETSGEGREEVVLLPLSVDTVAPQILSASVLAPPAQIVSNGDEIVIDICLDSAVDSISALFTALDSEFEAKGVGVEAFPDNCYRISYTVSLDNTVPDTSPLQVPVEVFDAGGNSDREFLLFCISNNPPEIVDLRVLNDFNNFVNGDTVKVRVQFTSSQPSIDIYANFSALDSGWNPTKVTLQSLGNLTYDISYPISLNNDNVDERYIIEITGRDNGCGTVSDTLGVTLDNGGDFSPIFTNVSISREAFSPNSDGFGDQVTVRFTVVEDTVVVRLSLIGVIAGELFQTALISFDTPYPQGDHIYVWDGTMPQVPALECDPDSPGKDMQLRIYGRTTDSNLRRVVTKDLHVDCRPPSLMSVNAAETAVRNGDRLEIDLTYNESELDILADFSSLDSEFDGQAPVNANGVAYTVIYDVSLSNSLADAVDIPIPITAVDPSGNRSSDSSVRFCLDNNPPRLVNARFVDGQKSAYKSGDSFRVETTWDTTVPLDVVFDFSNVDAEYDPTRAKAFPDTTNTVYTLTYTIEDADDKDATGIPIGVTATEQAELGCGATTVADLFRVDIDTERPRGPVVNDPPPVVRENRVLLSGLAEGSVLVEVRRNGDAVDTLEVRPDGSIVEDYVELVRGENVLDFTGIDAAGNRSTPGRPKTVFFADEPVATIPKPFSPGQQVFIALLEPADSVVLRILNFEGMTIRKLDAGSGDTLEIPWDGKDDNGSYVNSGPYIAIIEINGPGGLTRLREPFVFTNR